jgi:hypothetical protein
MCNKFAVEDGERTWEGEYIMIVNYFSYASSNAAYELNWIDRLEPIFMSYILEVYIWEDRSEEASQYES